MSPPASDLAPTDGPAPQRVLFVSGSGASATLRYRVRLPEEALRSRGVRTAAVHFTDRAAAALAEEADVVILYRCAASQELVDLVAALRRRPRPPLVTYDVDDLVFRPEHLAGMSFLGDLRPDVRATFERDVALRQRMVPYADIVTGSTQQVLDELGRLTDAPQVLLPNGVGRVGLGLADRAMRVPRHDDGRVRVGYFSGSATHDADWLVAEPAVVELLGARPEVDLWLVGPVESSAALEPFESRVHRQLPVPWTQLPDLLRQVDVALAPLDRTPFTEAKSVIKWLEAALVGTPTIATATPPFVAAVDDGRTGLLVSDDEGWLGALTGLVDSAGRRSEIGAAARVDALAELGPEVQADRLLAALTSPVRRSPTDVAADGAPLPRGTQLAPVLLAPYPWPHDLAPLQLRASGWDRVPTSLAHAAGWLVAARVRPTRQLKRAAYNAVQRVRRLTGRPAEAP